MGGPCRRDGLPHPLRRPAPATPLAAPHPALLAPPYRDRLGGADPRHAARRRSAALGPRGHRVSEAHHPAISIRRHRGSASGPAAGAALAWLRTSPPLAKSSRLSGDARPHGLCARRTRGRARGRHGEVRGRTGSTRARGRSLGRHPPHAVTRAPSRRGCAGITAPSDTRVRPAFKLDRGGRGDLCRGTRNSSAGFGGSLAPRGADSSHEPSGTRLSA